MEHGDVGNRKWQIALSSVALACTECKGPITPCIICAHPIPFVDDAIWVECGYCGAVNPICEHERHLLGLPPPLALTPSMVRRVMVAHIGRCQYTVALLSQFHQFQMAQDITTCSDQNKDGISQQKLDDTDTLSKVKPNTKLCDLPFVEYDGIVALSVDSNKLNQFEAKDTTEGEPLLKRMRITSENEGLATHNVRGHSGSEENCMQMPNQLDEISTHKTDFTSSNADINNSSDKKGFSMEDKVEENDFGRKSHEVKAVQESTRCSKCGSFFIEIGKFPFTSEGSFVRMETQLLALHSVESLSSDLHSLSSTSTYPLCGSIHISATKVAGEKTCVSQHNSICGCRQQFSHFSINVLRLAHSALAFDWKKWLVDSKLNFKEQIIDDVLKCIELFLEKRRAIFHAQGMMWKAMAAQAQSTLDSRAFLEHQLYISAASLLTDIFMERVQERCNTFKKLLEPFTMLLDQINVLLKFCFEQLGSPFKDPYLCSLQLESGSKFNGAYHETETVSQAIQAAVPLWLLLYHDLAHATVLGQVKSPANK